MADRKQEPVVVIGLGRFGSALAAELTRRGTEVLAIESDAKVVQSLSGQLTHVVAADATDIEALRQLGVPEFNRAVVGIGTNIEASILAASLLVDLEIDNIWAKAVTRQHGRILSRIGVHHVVFPEHDMGLRVAHLVSEQIQDYVEVDENFAIVKTKPPKEAVGVPLGETKLRSKYGVTVVSVKSRGEPFTYATADTVLTDGDTIIVSGTIDDVERFVESG
ncbi:MAG TPA: TrkA family potassium uptake protein [Streptosporangiaceae bacterium]|nr:TrkA family potassium uptake protein [Streptosporangiaceae bacterium]